ncbi:MAG: hypothetical protein V1720_06900 [bacterium]
MNLKFTKDKKDFLGKWVLANAISWPVGIIVSIGLSYGIVNLFYPKDTNLIVGFCLGTIVTITQWYIIKGHFNIGTWWIFSASIGIGLPFVIIFIFFELSEREISITEIEIIDQAILFFFCGLLTGILQYNVLKTFSNKSIWWIIISGLAWGISWFGLFLGGAILGLITGVALLYLLEFPEKTKCLN